MATKSKAKSKAKSKPKSKAKVKGPAKKAAIKTQASAKPSASQARGDKNLFTPLEDRVIIRIDAIEEKTAGGLFIPTTAGERPNRGEVVATGPGRRNKKGQLRPLDLKTGDRVLFPQYAGTKINVKQDEFLILREEEVLGIVT